MTLFDGGERIFIRRAWLGGLSLLLILTLLMQLAAPVIQVWAASESAAAKRSWLSVEDKYRPAAQTPPEWAGQIIYLSPPGPYPGPITTTAGHRYGLFVQTPGSTVIRVKDPSANTVLKCEMMTGGECWRYDYTSDGQPLTITSGDKPGVLAVVDLDAPNLNVLFHGLLPEAVAPIPVQPGHLYRFHFSYSQDGGNVGNLVNVGVFDAATERKLAGAYTSGTTAAKEDAFLVQASTTSVLIRKTGTWHSVPEAAVMVTLVDLGPADSIAAGRMAAQHNACLANQSQAFAADPVNTRTGNFTLPVTDFALPTRGLPLAFTRTYNAQDDTVGPLGSGWTHNYNTRLQAFSSGELLVLVTPEGSSLPFTRTSDGSYTPGPGVRATLAKNANGSFTLRRGDGVVYTFDTASNRYRLLRETDPQGRATTLTYTNGKLTRVTAADGRALSLAYTGSGRISRITDPAGRTVTFGYTACDGVAYLTSARDRSGALWTYTYTAGRMTAFTDPTGATVTNVYDAAGRVVTQYNPLQQPTIFDYTHERTVVTDPAGRALTYFYNAAGALTAVRDGQGQTTTYQYDQNFNLVASTNPRGQTTRYTWDAQGCSYTAMQDALGQTTTFTYDTQGNLTTMTDPRQRVLTVAYDAANNMTALSRALAGHVFFTSTFSYDAQQQVRASADARGNTTTYTYDAYGYPRTVVDALGQTTRFQFDLVGRMTAATDPNGATTTFVYDTGDRLREVRDALGGVTTYTYDAAGRLIAWTDANQHTTTLGYDAAGRVLTETNALGAATFYRYDPAGQLRQVINALRQATTFTYDAAGRLTQVRDAAQRTTTYGYDAAGNLTSILPPGAPAAATFEYDALDRPVAMTDPLGQTTWYGYDAAGNLTTVLVPDGALATYTYTPQDLLAQVRLPGGRVAAAFQYDRLGNLVQATDGRQQTTTYAYDALNRLTTVHDILGATDYGYDPAGNLAAVTDAQQQTTLYGYDALGRLTSTLPPGLPATTYAYDPVGNLTLLTAADGSRTTATYDALDRPTAIQYPATSAAPGYSVGYTYDALGRRASMSDPTGVTAYHYDALSRPITITAPYVGSVAYRYDAAGRRSTTRYPTGETVTYTYDAANRLSGVQGWDGAETAYTYDAAGQLHAEQRANGTRAAYSYDAEGRLTGIVDGAGQNWSSRYHYTLDGAGNRIAVQESAALFRIYLPLILREYTADTLVSINLPPFSTAEPDPLVSPLAAPALLSPLATPDAPLETPPAPEVMPTPEARSWQFWQEAWVWLTQCFTAAPIAAAAPQETSTFVSPLSTPPGEIVTHYTYDARNQLTGAASSTGAAYSYTYDAVGNRTALTSTATAAAYTYAAGNRLTAIAGVAQTHDARGNLLADGRFTYHYDGADRLVRVEDGAASVTYQYNGDGLRVAETRNGQTTYFTWDQALELPQLLATSDGTRYLQGLGLTAVERDGQWYYPHTDALGSLRRWSDASGAAVGALSYDPYGGITQEQGIIPSPLGFAGEWHDPTTGLQYLRARWYQPATGRFTQVDPFPGVLALPATQHPYQYALNSPTRYTDPSGESVLLTLGIIAAAGIAAGATELLFNQLPPVVNAYGGYQNVLQAIRCGGLARILDLLDAGALAGAVTNALVAGALAAVVVWAIPIFIAGLPLSGLGALGASIALHWLYGGAIGFVGGLAGAAVQAAIHRQPVVYTPAEAESNFFWGSLFLFSSATLGHLANHAVVMQFRGEATNIATAMARGGVPGNNIELQQIARLARNGTPKNIGDASLFDPSIFYITLNQLATALDVILNDNYWQDFLEFIENYW